MNAALDTAWRIEPFGHDRWPQCRAELLRGYPASSAAWWQAGYRRSIDVPTNRPDHPAGLLLHGPQGLVGVTMLYASERPGAPGTGPQLHVNLSSWAMAPGAREKALWFARRGLDDPAAVYSSLTPAMATAGILRRLRFEPISQQLVLCVTPRLALRQDARGRVLDAATTLAELKSDPMHRLLEDHHRLGCLVAAVETPNGLLPVVFRARRRARRIRVADLIYTPSTAALTRAVGPLSRFLLKRGYPLLEFEADQYLPIEFPATRLFRLRLARGPYPRQGVDHLYSELVYLHR